MLYNSGNTGSSIFNYCRCRHFSDWFYGFSIDVDGDNEGNDINSGIISSFTNRMVNVTASGILSSVIECKLLVYLHGIIISCFIIL